MKLKTTPRPKPEPKLPLQAFRLRNFKAVRDSGEVHFTPLTVLIGKNGSGKSSLIEALETFQNVIQQGIDDAFIPWKGFESVWNKAVSHKPTEDQVGKISPSNPMEFEAVGLTDAIPFQGKIEINKDEKRDQIFITNQDFDTPLNPPKVEKSKEMAPEFHVRDLAWHRFVYKWQFISLEPSRMLEPKPQRRSLREIRLAKDGSNIAQYLQSIADTEPTALEGIVEALKAVLPYADDLRPAITSELERNVYLTLTEKGLKEPLGGWLLSQGTLRILALFAVLRHPKPPSVVFIEELENGLDFRTVQMLVEEIRQFVNGTGRQVVVTTHSPYLLDLVPLSQVVLVTRKAKGPSFWRPTESKELREWAEDYGPGSLFTMGRLQQKEGQ
jgi:predicted ATPase